MTPGEISSLSAAGDSSRSRYSASASRSTVSFIGCLSFFGRDEQCYALRLSLGNYHLQDAISKLRYDAKPMLQFGIVLVRFDELQAGDHVFNPSSSKLTFCHPS